MVGLSATIASPDVVGKFLVGEGRPVEIVHMPVARRMKLEIFSPEPTGEDVRLAGKLFTHPEVAARLRVMKGMINDHNSVLLFTNTRSIAEELASSYKDWDIDFPVSIHHGILTMPAYISAQMALIDVEI